MVVSNCAIFNKKKSKFFKSQANFVLWFWIIIITYSFVAREIKILEGNFHTRFCKLFISKFGIMLLNLLPKELLTLRNKST